MTDKEYCEMVWNQKGIKSALKKAKHVKGNSLTQSEAAKQKGFREKFGFSPNRN